MYGDNTRSASRFTTPLAAPPPPLHLLSAQQGRGAHNMHLPAYAGARHTLGPMFNDEEDGDDSAFIAQQMNLLGLNEGQGQAGGRNQNQNGQRRRNTTTSSPNTSNRRNNRRQARSQTQEPEREVDPTQQAAAYLALQAQAQQALLAAQFQSVGIDHHTQQALAQRYQMQLQLAALQLQQHEQQHQHQQTRPQRRPSPNPPSQPHTHMSYNQSQQHHDPAFASASDQRNHLAAQVQANLLARTRRQKNLDDAETRARFEAAPNINKDQSSPHQATQAPLSRAAVQSKSTENLWGGGPGKPFTPEVSPATFSSRFAPTDSTEKLWKNEPAKTSTSAFTSRFGSRAQVQPGSQLSSAHSSTDALSNHNHMRHSSEDTASTDTELSRADTTAQTSPKSTESGFENDDKLAIPIGVKPSPGLGLGLGRPARAWSTPALSASSANVDAGQSQPRSTSYTAGGGGAGTGAGAGPTVVVIRQPFGPPGNAEKLKEENFKTLLRKRAGAGLHMLNRRASPSAQLTSLV